jgi:phospholipase/carboxylesterase
MHEEALIVAAPEAPRELVLLFHGVGATAAHLLPIGQAVAQSRPEAFVVSVQAPHASTLGSGREWFSVVGISEHNRQERMAHALPLFHEAIGHWRQHTGIGADRTTLVGFSQGAIMALESTQAATQQPAHAVVALAGRFAGPVRQVPAGVRFHLIHGVLDGVVPTSWSVQAQQELLALNAPVTLDLVPDLGRGIDARAIDLVMDRLAQA